MCRMAPPPISIFGKLSGDRLFRIDGGPLGSSKYNLMLEVTNFKGNAWSSDFTLSALKDSFEEMVPETDDLLAWLSALPSNKTVQLKEDGEETWIKAELEDAEALRLPPSGSLRKVGAEDAGAISAGIALALFDNLQQVKLSGKGERRPSAGASPVRSSQQLGSPTKASPHKAARTLGMTTASQSLRPDPEDAAAGSASPSDDERKPSQRSADDDVPQEQRHRVVRGRGRGRMSVGFGGRGRRSLEK